MLLLNLQIVVSMVKRPHISTMHSPGVYYLPMTVFIYVSWRAGQISPAFQGQPTGMIWQNQPASIKPF
jgi:hypothetical protein